MADPRTSIINERLRKISNVIAVSSGKGGVGKSVVASTLALALVKMGYRVGLFDIDFTSPSTHIILGIEGMKPEEDKGIIPPQVHGMAYMSLIYFSGSEAIPLRGADVSNALIELLSVVKWEELDYLIIDMPPGIGDVTLDLVRLVRDMKVLIVATPSQLAFETVEKLVNLLKALNVQVLGVVENMKMPATATIEEQTEKLALEFLGEIQYDSHLEEAIGNVHKLRETVLAKRVEEIASKINAGS
jgi:ATP-binding protein involved in chromosome partitioning